jgi:hypothetical protein
MEDQPMEEKFTESPLEWTDQWENPEYNSQTFPGHWGAMDTRGRVHVAPSYNDAARIVREHNAAESSNRYVLVVKKRIAVSEEFQNTLGCPKAFEYWHPMER